MTVRFMLLVFVSDRSVVDNTTTKTDGFCGFEGLNGCGYGDASTQAAHWTMTTDQAPSKDPSVPWDWQGHGDAECSTNADGRMYVGSLNRTISGRQCQRWDQQMPHSNPFDKLYYFTDFALVDGGGGDGGGSLGVVENFCRNPAFENDFQPAPWCWTTDPEVEWEYCLVPYCQSMRILLESVSNSNNSRQPMKERLFKCSNNLHYHLSLLYLYTQVVP